MLRKFNEPWSATIVGRMHRYNITNQELARACNYSPSYLSQVLHGNKKFRSKESYERTVNRISSICESLINDILREVGDYNG